jgi:hypothetical protein
MGKKGVSVINTAMIMPLPAGRIVHREETLAEK